MRRLEELDALRGLVLVWITLTHMPTVLSTYVNQPFGFVSAAEGFIFLSALFTGRICFRLAQRDGYRAMWQKLRSRTLRLYLYHASLLGFVFLVAVPIAASGMLPGLHNLLDFYFNAGARRAVVDGALLVYRPPLLDILPMYVIFLALTPLALSIARRVGWKLILSGGFAIWVLAQFGLRQVSWQLMNRYFGLRIPLNEMGSFDLWAWQFLWGFTGNSLGFGYRDLGLGEFLRSGFGTWASPNVTWRQFAPKQDGRMQVSSARNVAMTPAKCTAGTDAPGPYFQKEFFHNGYIKSLKQLVHFYNTRDVYPFPVTSGHCPA